MTTDHCGTGNTASPTCSAEHRDWEEGVAVWCVTWSCMDCGTVVDVERRSRLLVTGRGGFCGDGSDPDRGADRHLSGCGFGGVR